jgi:hypothetical protein
MFFRFAPESGPQVHMRARQTRKIEQLGFVVIRLRNAQLGDADADLGGAKDRERLLAQHFVDDLGNPLHAAAPVKEFLRHRIDVAVKFGEGGIDPRSAFLVSSSRSPAPG